MSFDDWYKANIEPGLLRPPGATQEQFDMLRKAARGSMAACWNAALDAVSAECGVWPETSGGVEVRICRIGEIYLDKVLRAE